MANEIKYQDVVKTALAEVGYQGTSTSSKYSAELDSVKFYNYPKQGSASWCAIFYDWCVWKNRGNFSTDQVRSILCEPNSDNCGAGCTQKVQYYKSKGRYYTRSKDATTGDEIFFKKSNGAIYHTGIIVDWNSSGFYVVEGNTNGNQVAKKFYSFGDSKIAGFGRPDWYKYQTASEPDPKPVTNNGYTADEIKVAKDVIQGKYGNGQTRGLNLQRAGYDYYRIQGLVNKILRGEIKV